MYSYIARRLAFGALTVVGVSIMVFVVMRILPGDPLVAIFGPEGMTKLTDEQRANYMKDLGLSDPLWVQYFNWVKEIAAGNFGCIGNIASGTGIPIVHTVELLDWAAGGPKPGALA